MDILVTGSEGFIGKNLIVRLNELNLNILTFSRHNTKRDLVNLIHKADIIVHLAGVNRPIDEKDFKFNESLTQLICDEISCIKRKISIIFASSSQVKLENAYGKSKLVAENYVNALKVHDNCETYIYRLPGVFGKWCKPNYNSVVATFCHNISRELPINVHNPNSELSLVYIDDVVDEFLKTIKGLRLNKKQISVKPQYKIKLGNLSEQIQFFKNSRLSLITENVGLGFIRKLYSTYLSYLPPTDFSYSIPTYEDERGKFVEVIKTKKSGQFSFFTVHPGVIRGNHYHHSKNEKFLVVKGNARFSFRHIISNEKYEIITSSKELKVVETVPGWSHNIANIGTEEMIVLLWANEIFDPKNPDTIISKV